MEYAIFAMVITRHRSFGVEFGVEGGCGGVGGILGACASCRIWQKRGAGSAKTSAPRRICAKIMTAQPRAVYQDLGNEVGACIPVATDLESSSGLARPIDTKKYMSSL